MRLLEEGRGKEKEVKVRRGEKGGGRPKCREGIFCEGPTIEKTVLHGGWAK